MTDDVTAARDALRTATRSSRSGRIALVIAGIAVIVAGISIAVVLSKTQTQVQSNTDKAETATDRADRNAAKNNRQDNRISRVAEDKDVLARAVFGPRGFKGDTGLTGPLGKRGLTGLTGLDGKQGLIGAQGATGASTPGPTGPAGAMGLGCPPSNPLCVGPPGPKGEDSTVPGPQGPGPTDAQVQAAVDAYCAAHNNCAPVTAPPPAPPAP